MPYSLTTQWTSPRAIATGWPGASSGRIAGCPAGVRDARLHLTNVYRKLGIPGRAGLAEALAR
jgi:hypothetical protein